MLQILWIFPLYAFFGWCLEVMYAAVKTGKFVNRGFLNGGLCPIYGVGAAVLIPLLTPMKDDLLILFLAAIVLASALELVGGFLLKRLFHISWWDYTAERFHIGGYICLKFSLIWGLCGVLLVRVIQPPLAYVAARVPISVLVPVLVLFYVYFVVDVMITVMGVLKLNRDLQEITRLAGLIRKSGDVIGEGLALPTLQAAERIRAMDIPEKARAGRERLQARMEDFDRLNALLERRSAVQARLLRAFPRMRNLRHDGALNEVRRRIRARVGRKRK